ncbi:MAG: SusE domain-containing protein [Muribaculum sp.]|nr:SusE domain-containing protein [Muribaculum sp.]
MKKILLLFAVLLTAVTFTACSDDEDPKAYKPTDKNFLNVPPLSAQTYDLQTAGTVQLTCSQPNYGVGTTPMYGVQVSLNEDFTTVYTGSEVYDPANAVAYVELPYSTTNTTLEVPAKDMANGISTMLGYTDISQYEGRTPYSGPLYVRLRSYFPKLDGELAEMYSIESNVVKLDNVIGYATVRQPAWIYLVGAPEGWAGPTEANADHYEPWKLYEADDAIGSDIYYGTFMIPDGQFQFRFYKALTGWDDDSYGSQKDDNPVDIAFEDEEYSGPIVKGKGSYQVPGWTAAWVKMTVNLKSMSVTFDIVEDPAQ